MYPLYILWWLQWGEPPRWHLCRRNASGRTPLSPLFYSAVFYTSTCECILVLNKFQFYTDLHYVAIPSFLPSAAAILWFLTPFWGIYSTCCLFHTLWFWYRFEEHSHVGAIPSTLPSWASCSPSPPKSVWPYSAYAPLGPPILVSLFTFGGVVHVSTPDGLYIWSVQFLKIPHLFPKDVPSLAIIFWTVSLKIFTLDFFHSATLILFLLRFTSCWLC